MLCFGHLNFPVNLRHEPTTLPCLPICHRSHVSSLWPPQRLLGKRVRFVTGTDEHGEKIAAAAAARGMTPQQHCDDIVAQYTDLWSKVRGQDGTTVWIWVTGVAVAWRSGCAAQGSALTVGQVLGVERVLRELLLLSMCRLSGTMGHQASDACVLASFRPIN